MLPDVTGSTHRNKHIPYAFGRERFAKGYNSEKNYQNMEGREKIDQQKEKLVLFV